MRKSMLKQEFLEFRVSESEGCIRAMTEHFHLWSQVAITLKTKGGLDYLSFDDLYNKLRTLEIDVKGGSSYDSRGTSAPTYSAFISAASTNSKMSYLDQSHSTTFTSVSSSPTTSSNVMENILHSFVAKSDPQQQITYEDFDQIEIGLEEININWRMAMSSPVSINRFEKKARRKMKFNNKDAASDAKQDHEGEDVENGAAQVYGMIAGAEEDAAGSATGNATGDVADDVSNAAAEFALMVTSPSDSKPLAFASCVSSVKSSSSKTNEPLASVPSSVAFQTLSETADQQPSSTNDTSSFSFKEHVKPPRNLCNKSGVNSRSLCKRKSFGSKTCFVCGSKFHLIKDCDFYEKQLELHNKPMWNNVATIPSFVPKAASVPAGSRNRPTSVPAGSRNRPTSVPTGRPFSAGWKNNAARPMTRPTSHYFHHLVVLAIITTKMFYKKINDGEDGELLLSPQQENPHKNRDLGIVDSGCSRSMTDNKEQLDDFVKIVGGTVTFGGGDGKITGKGTIRTSKLNFENVYYVEELQNFNLFSVSQICDTKNKVLFTDKECLVLSKEFQLLENSQVVLRVPRRNNLYCFNLSDIKPERDVTCLLAKASLVESTKWHRRMAHVNFKNMNKLAKHGLVNGLPSKLFTNEHNCVACNKGKQHKASYKAITAVSTISAPLQLLHMDLFGPTSIRSIDHKYYSLVVTDDFSRFTWVFFLGTKDETYGILKDFITFIENQLTKKVKAIRCDNGTEFKNSKLIELCGSKGIRRDYSNAKTPQQNGVAERKNRTLIEAARTMLADSKLPTMFWTEAVSTACYVLNRVLVTKPHNKTPYELVSGKVPNISHLKPFGCLVTILNTSDHLGKFEGKADEGFIVGYAAHSKAYRVYNLSSKKIEETLNLRYLEDKPNVQGTQDTNIHAGTQDDSDSECDEHVIVVPSFPSNSFSGPRVNEASEMMESSSDYAEELARLQQQEFEANTTAEKHLSQADLATSRNGVPAGKIVSAADVSAETSTPVCTPIHTAATSLPPGNSLGSSVQSTRYPSPSDLANTMSSSSAMEDIHHHPDTGIFSSSSYDDDFGGTVTNLAPSVVVDSVPTKRNKRDARVARIEAIRLFLAFPGGAVIYGIYGMNQMDVKSAFPLWSCEKLCMVPSSSNKGWIQTVYFSVKAQLQKSQDKYVQDMLKKFDMESVRPATTPFEASKPKSKDEPDDAVNVHLYRSMIVKKIFKYLKGQPKLGLWYPRDSPFVLEAYSDSDYAGSHATSFTEAEICAAATVVVRCIIHEGGLAFFKCYSWIVWPSFDDKEFILVGLSVSSGGASVPTGSFTGSYWLTTSYWGSHLRQDLLKLYGMVVKYYEDHPLAGAGMMLWGDLQVLFESHEGGHDGSYPLSVQLMKKMLKHKLEIEIDGVGNDMTYAEQLIQFIKNQIAASIPSA
ncbi:putative ribonuclease H-like domain-containing protein [Tanacetum coccineum]|uniref:Ribonuclease H-like domain-containing protein n=1 Tax=Tanacetum coccineum TaxID=301880 RepID=A0ABQ5CDH9_9ASTR